MSTSDAQALEGHAHVEGTLGAAAGVALHIAGHRIPNVREQVPGTQFPSRCPERHIQSDQTFCLGLCKLDVSSDIDAQQWWEQLRQYLVCQSVAERTGIWPPGHALDHGDAGASHARAVAISAELGISEQYAAARLGEPSWITGREVRLFGKDGKPINGRAPCPLGCRGRRGRVKLRRECKRRELVLELVRAEAQRRKQLAAYWDDVRALGTVCCGRMRQCELKPRSSAHAGE